MKPGSGSWLRISALALLLALSGCSTVGYYFQAIDGHLQLWRRAVPFEEAIEGAPAGSALAGRLARALAIREFASRELALPDNGSYRRYADVGRPYVLWNVFAAAELSLRPTESCFAFAGCVAYRGFYSETDALAYASGLAGQGLDTHVGGVVAYSTLGWFDDPVLSTFVHYPESELARIIFHELAHQVVYVRDDSRFNESFAVAVEQEGLRRWFASHAGDRLSDEARRWQAAQNRRTDFFVLMHRHRLALENIYASAASASVKRAGKARQFDLLQQDYESLKAAWGGFQGYERLFAKVPNNALFASISVYSDYVPAFSALLDKHRGDMRAFYAEVRELGRLEKGERIARLTAGEGRFRE